MTATDAMNSPPEPEGPQNLALILSQEAKQLMAMDRYEQRALVTAKICDPSL